jgi:hypothetical protein
MGRQYWWVLDGKTPRPATQEEASYFLMDNDKRRIAIDTIEASYGSVTVSTVFLPIDHRVLGDGPPLVFESLVFGGPLSDEMQRYSSWEEAEAGHAELLQRVKATFAVSQA